MSTVPQIKGYYESYWNRGKNHFSGDQQGYAANFRRWMKRELVGLPPSTPILEVGCGDGSFTKELAHFSSQITAIDISGSQIADNAGRLPGIKFLQHDVAERLPFANGAFRVVWCSEVLEHLFDPSFALQEMHRVLRPGGKLLVTVPYHGRLKNVLIALFKFEVHYAPSNPHIRFYTRNTLSRLAHAAGFGNVYTETCGMNLPVRDFFSPTNILLRASAAG